MRPRTLLRMSLGAVATVGAALVSACESSSDGGTVGPPSDTPVAAANVAILSAGGNRFEPAEVFVIQNGTVTWNNGSGVNHNVTFSVAPGAPLNIDTFSSGVVQRTFTTSGTYNYQCTLHAGMNGSVRVQ